MRPNPQFHVDLVTITEEIFNGKRHCFVQCTMRKGYTFTGQIINNKAKGRISKLVF